MRGVRPAAVRSSASISDCLSVECSRRAACRRAGSRSIRSMRPRPSSADPQGRPCRPSARRGARGSSLAADDREEDLAAFLRAPDRFDADARSRRRPEVRVDLLGARELTGSARDVTENFEGDGTVATGTSATQGERNRGSVVAAAIASRAPGSDTSAASRAPRTADRGQQQTSWRRVTISPAAGSGSDGPPGLSRQERGDGAGAEVGPDVARNRVVSARPKFVLQKTPQASIVGKTQLE